MIINKDSMKYKKLVWKYLNKYLIQLIIWASIIVIVSRSNACPEWKVLYLLIALLGFNQSCRLWFITSNKTESEDKK